MKNFFRKRFHQSLVRKHEVLIMYFDRLCESLVVNSELMVIPENGCTIEQVLDRLRQRGGSWAYELDSRNVRCDVDGINARRFDHIDAGAEISISSRKSIFEP